MEKSFSEYNIRIYPHRGRYKLGSALKLYSTNVSLARL